MNAKICLTCKCNALKALKKCLLRVIKYNSVTIKTMILFLLNALLMTLDSYFTRVNPESAKTQIIRRRPKFHSGAYDIPRSRSQLGRGLLHPSRPSPREFATVAKMKSGRLSAANATVMAFADTAAVSDGGLAAASLLVRGYIAQLVHLTAIV